VRPYLLLRAAAQPDQTRQPDAQRQHARRLRNALHLHEVVAQRASGTIAIGVAVPCPVIVVFAWRKLRKDTEREVGVVVHFWIRGKVDEEARIPFRVVDILAAPPSIAARCNQLRTVYPGCAVGRVLEAQVLRGSVALAYIEPNCDVEISCRRRVEHDARCEVACA
jgi:hypothetical protein